jgi:hypothetical protein
MSGSNPILQRVVARVNAWILPSSSSTLRLVFQYCLFGSGREESLPLCLESKLLIVYPQRKDILERSQDLIFDRTSASNKVKVILWRTHDPVQGSRFVLNCAQTSNRPCCRTVLGGDILAQPGDLFRHTEIPSEILLRPKPTR